MTELYDLFGSKLQLAQAIGEHPSVVSRWYNSSGGGKIPHRFNTAILNAAWERKMNLDEVGGFLMACPVCQCPMEPAHAVVRHRGKK